MLHLFSPAKVNLFLRITGKRTDGYHNLESLFQAINLGDSILFKKNEGGVQDSLTTNHPDLSVNSTNLILKATELFRKKTGLQFSLNIHLEKNIPMEAGLGGGSSNAATALWACNQLTGKQISVDDLKAWSAEIGSDVPFFFSEGTAFCMNLNDAVSDYVRNYLLPGERW